MRSTASGGLGEKGATDGSLTTGGLALRVFLGVSLFFALLIAWGKTNRVDFEASLDEAGLIGEDLSEFQIVDLGSTLPMTTDSDTIWILSYGFGAPESDGTWIVDPQSQIVFEARTGSPETLELSLYPFLHERLGKRDVEISTSVGTEVFTLTDGINSVAVPLDRGRRQVIEIGCGQVESPRELGVGADDRTLCAKLLSVRVE